MNAGAPVTHVPLCSRWGLAPSSVMPIADCASAVQNLAMSTASRSRATPNAKADRHFVTALARGLDLLACFRARDRVLSNQELARRSGLPKSTISRLTYTLTKIGYLEPAGLSGGPGYRLG